MSKPGSFYSKSPIKILSNPTNYYTLPINLSLSISYWKQKHIESLPSIVS
jgi:hypothetical protein